MNRCFILGIDGLSASLTAKAVACGKMPNLKKLLGSSFQTPIIPTMPASTPPGWAAISTGAWPSKNGVEGFLVHRTGRQFDDRLNGCRSGVCRAEFLWDVVSSEGGVPILLKFPISWPPTADKGLQIDGAGGWGGVRCHYEIAPQQAWDSDPSDSSGPLEIKPPESWINIPPDVEPLFESKFQLKPTFGSDSVWVHLLIFLSSGELKVGISLNRDFSRLAVSLKEGEWSSPLEAVFYTNHGLVTGIWRVKILYVSHQRRLRLFQTSVHEADGYIFPKSSEDRLLNDIGWIQEDTGIDAYLKGQIDADTLLEAYESQCSWLAATIGNMTASYEWDLFMTHWHFLDWAHHLWWAGWDPLHPGYKEALTAGHSKFLDRAYKITDRLIGLVRNLMHKDTYFAIVGDHGANAYHTTFAANHLLLREELLKMKTSEDGSPVIDWENTAAYSTGVHIYFNMVGREPMGAVQERERENIAKRIISRFSELKDHEYGASPVKFVISREEARPFGLWGEGVGDLIMILERGYQNRNFIKPADGDGSYPLFYRQRVGSDYTAEHNCFDPRTPEIQTLFILNGPGVVPMNKKDPSPVVDIAPTVAKLMQVRNPAHADGKFIEDLFL